MKRLSVSLIPSLLTLTLPIIMGTTALAQESANPKSFDELLQQIQNEKNPAPEFGFPIPPVKAYDAPMPWGPDTSIFLKSNSDGSVEHTISKFICPENIKGAPLRKAWIQNPTGSTAHCDYKSKSLSFRLIIDGVGGRPVDLDAMIEPTIIKAKKTPNPKSKKISLGKTSANCRYDAAVDPKGLDVTMIACHHESYVIQMLALGMSSKKSLQTLETVVDKQKDFVDLRKKCASHIKEIEKMEPSGATGRSILADSVEYEQNGPTCYFTAMLTPGIKGGFNQAVYTFPENPDTPLMMTLHRDDGRLIKTFRLQHAFAREADRDDKPAVYNLISTAPDGTHIVYETAYTRVLPIPRFFKESMNADLGKIKEKLELKRNAAGGFDMAMK